MRKTLTLILASTALTAAIVPPAWSALRASADGGLGALAADRKDGQDTLPLVLASDDDDDDDEDHDRRSLRSARDGGNDDDDDDDCDDDDGLCRASASSPTTGAAAPPRNGLFGSGAPPNSQVN